jgi:hypothetical protein
MDVHVNMALNILLDFVVGLIPFLGDIIDGSPPKNLP